MRFYNRQHRYYCGIDLHVKTMYVCILDGVGQVLVQDYVPRNIIVLMCPIGICGGGAGKARFASADYARAAT